MKKKKKKRGLQLLRDGGLQWFLVVEGEDGERETLSLESEREDVAGVTLPATRKIKVIFYVVFPVCYCPLFFPAFSLRFLCFFLFPVSNVSPHSQIFPLFLPNFTPRDYVFSSPQFQSFFSRFFFQFSAPFSVDSPSSFFDDLPRFLSFFPQVFRLSSPRFMFNPAPIALKIPPIYRPRRHGA